MSTSHPTTDAPTEPYDAADLDDLTRADRRELYERLLEIADAQASEAQLPWTRQVVIKRLACSILPCRHDAVEKLLDDLVDRKQLLRWTDRGDYKVVCICETTTLARAHSWIRERSTDCPQLEQWILHFIEKERGGGA